MNRFSDVGETVSAGDIQAVEERVGFRLPDELRQHYLRVNGGRPERSYFLRDDHDFELQRFMTLAELAKRVEDLVQTRHLIPDNLVPFAWGSGGDYYCVDRADQSIVFYAMDYCLEPEKATTKATTSLATFIDGMITEDEMYDELDED